MAPPRGRKRKASVVLPGGGGAAAPAGPPAPVPAESRYHTERFEDGSVRPVRNATHSQTAKEQALSDFFGVRPVLPLKANIRTMDSLLAEITGQLNLSEMDFAPEILGAAWAKAAGPFLANQAELVGVSCKKATIRTSHPAVRYELERLKPQIVRVLNKVLGDGSVATVRILHG